MKYFLIGSASLGHPQGELFHGIWRDGVYHRCGPYVPALMLPLLSRLLVSDRGRCMLSELALGACRFEPVQSMRVYEVDWLARLESGALSRGHWRAGSAFGGAAMIPRCAETLWSCHADVIAVGEDEEWVDERQVKVPVVLEKHIAGRDLVEFSFDRRLWQIGSPRLRARIEVALPGAFSFYPVSLW